MASPTDRRYLASHEWHKPEGDHVVIGISQFAVDELTDITYLEISADGAVAQHQPFGEIESVKATSELYSGIDGDIAEVNQAVVDNPALINEDPYGKGWIIKVRPADKAQLDTLLDGKAYDQQAGG